MSSRDRFPYESATVLSQALLDACQDNLTGKLEAIVEISAPDGSTIRASDRNKYVGEHFYEALTTFPQILRTLGEWLQPGLALSEVDFELSNADARFNHLLPGGASFGSWVGRSVVVKIGISDVEATYVTVFRGAVSQEAGFGRTVKSITLRARDQLEAVNVTFPSRQFNATDHPDAPESLWGRLIPVVYGDWTVDVAPGSASVPALPVNSANIFVTGKPLNVQLAVGTPGVLIAQNHRLSTGNKVIFRADGGSDPGGGLATGATYTVTVLGPNQFHLGQSITSIPAGNFTVERDPLIDTTLRNVALVISDNALEYFEPGAPLAVFLRRSDKSYGVPASQVVNVAGTRNSFEIKNDDAGFQIDGVNFIIDESDTFFVRCRGKYLDGFDRNAVWIARDILMTYAGLPFTSFDPTWPQFRDKATPSQSAVRDIKARAWVGEPQNAMEYAKSLLAQVRLEPFVSRSLTLSLNALHFDEWEASPTFQVRNWDVAKGSFAPRIDDRNNFNRARAVFSFLPNENAIAFATDYFKNTAAAAQEGRLVTKAVEFPNLHVEADVVAQLKEILRLSSGFREVIATGLTPRGFLLDVGDFVGLSVQIGSSQFDGVPCMVREIGYEPGTLRLNVKMWSMQMLPFPGWTPGFAGTVGGYSAVLTQG